MATFQGGKKLEARLRELAANVSKPGMLRVGFLAGATYPDGTPVAMIAAIQNWGAPRAGIPPRPFFSDTVAKGRKAWGDQTAAALKASDFDATRALGIMGDVIAGEIRQSIKDTNAPALKPATVKRKGFSKPLVDSGHMLQSVDYEIKG